MPQTRSLLLSLLLLIAATLLAACGRSAASPQQPPDLVLRLAQTGVYELSPKDLKSAGWDLRKLERTKVQLRSGDAIIPIDWPDKSDPVLRFYGQVTPTRYDNRAAYVLHYGDAASPKIGVRRVAPPASDPAKSFRATVRAEENSVYLAQVRDGDHWLGQRIFAPGAISLSIDTPDPDAGGGRMLVSLWGATAAPGDTDHHLIFELNGQQVGEEAWDGAGPHEIDLDLPNSALRPDGNELRITAPGDTGAPADLVYLNWVQLAYQRQLRKENGRLRFAIAAKAIEIADVGKKAVSVWDVTEPNKTVKLTDVTQKDNALAFTEKKSAERKYIVFSDDDLLSPQSITEAPPALTAPPLGADYIIIAPPKLVTAVQPLADWRTKQGMRTMLVTTDQVYLKFSDGMQTPEAITDLLRWATATWPAPAPRFVLLAGDASYDPLDYLPDAPNKNLIPTAFMPTAVMGETASDSALADLDGDGLPDLAIGRFPAQTPADITAMVAKTIAYEQSRSAGAWLKKLLFVADDDDPYFSSFNEDMIALTPQDFEIENLVISPQNDIRPDLLQALNDGRGLVSYMGHGALDIWAQEEIFTSADVANLSQGGKLPVMLVWACLNGYFQHPKRTSLGETLVLAPNKGVVAGLFPTGETFTHDQLMMARALFGKSLFVSPTLGEALLAAVRHLNPEDAGQRDIIHTFVLLGDPALKLSW